jgi:hypothetical protein
MGGFACEPYRCEYFVNYISALASHVEDAR